MGGRAWPAARQPLDPLLAGPSSSQSPLRPSHPSGSSLIHSPRSRPALPPDSGPKPVQPHQIPLCPSWDLDPPGSLWHVPPPTLSIECAFFGSGEESPLPCHRQTLVSAATLTCFLAAPQHMEFPGQGSHLSQCCEPHHSHGNTRSLTHCSGPGIEPESLQLQRHCGSCCVTVGTPGRSFEVSELRSLHL